MTEHNIIDYNNMSQADKTFEMLCSNDVVDIKISITGILKKYVVYEISKEAYDFWAKHDKNFLLQYLKSTNKTGRLSIVPKAADFKDCVVKGSLEEHISGFDVGSNPALEVSFTTRGKQFYYTDYLGGLRCKNVIFDPQGNKKNARYYLLIERGSPSTPRTCNALVRCNKFFDERALGFYLYKMPQSTIISTNKITYRQAAVKPIILRDFFYSNSTECEKIKYVGVHTV